MFYSMFFVFLQHESDKIAVKCEKICPFQKIVVILYPIKFASIGNWHKICKEISKKTTK